MDSTDDVLVLMQIRGDRADPAGFDRVLVAHAHALSAHSTVLWRISP